ncbi:CPBP family intramembrane glutamic endopeptidase [Enterococcus hirae]|nr:CPBP family intramembrane glutamic endopeptidase [Enterococcus hirae]MDD9144543.1 CPBP family intramembrane metalloprotease [Enterococcus hirae]MEB5733846.1 CPBP family intramembrane metalloprotease [Enterococcus hirae]MEC4731185.1 CPBP family intramembrane metalloprotease [Enterococcus hirae]
MIFRFSLISLHSDRKTKASLLIISSFLFSIVHGGNFNLFFCGVLFGFVYIKTSNMWYSILTHVFYNGVGIFLFLFFI